MRSYEACAEPGSGEDPSCQFGEISPDPNRVYRDVESFKKNSFGYAYTMTGMGFGNENVGAYAGIASYLITGESTIRSTTNKLYAWVPGRSSVAVQRGSSNMGAPNGPFDVCISDVVGGKCTNTTREFPRGSCTRTIRARWLKRSRPHKMRSHHKGKLSTFRLSTHAQTSSRSLVSRTARVPTPRSELAAALLDIARYIVHACHT